MCSLLTETLGGIFIAPTSWIKRPSGREVNELCWVTHVEMNLAPPTPHWLGGQWTAKGGDTGPGEAWQPAARSPAAQLPCWGVYSLCRGQGAGLPEAGACGVWRRTADQNRVACLQPHPQTRGPQALPAPLQPPHSGRPSVQSGSGTDCRAAGRVAVRSAGSGGAHPEVASPRAAPASAGPAVDFKT